MILVHFTQTGPAQSTPATVDERDLIDVTDPVRQIAADALATMNLQLPKAKLNQRQLPDAKDCIKEAVGVMSDLPEVSNLSRLKKNVMKTGNMSFFCQVINLSSGNISSVLVPTSYFLILSVKSELLRMSSRLAEKKQVEQPVFPEREAVFEQSKPGPSRKRAETQAAPDDVYMARIYQPKVKVTRLQNTKSPQKVPPQAGNYTHFTSKTS